MLFAYIHTSIRVCASIQLHLCGTQGRNALLPDQCLWILGLRYGEADQAHGKDLLPPEVRGRAKLVTHASRDPWPLCHLGRAPWAWPVCCQCRSWKRLRRTSLPGSGAPIAKASLP